MMRYLKSFKKMLMTFAENKYGEQRAKKIWEDTERIYCEFVSEAPDIGGRGNIMAHNLYQALAIFAFYEAVERDLSEDDINFLVNGAFVNHEKLGKFIDINRLDCAPVRFILHKLIAVYKKKADKYRGGKWNNSWGIEINPEGHKNGFAVTLVGCPIAEFAEKHGYSDIMPILCQSDYTATEYLHGRLIRKHTVAQGYDKCDYWIIGDKSSETV